MENLIQDTVNYLENEQDEFYDVFISTITTELVIPKTRGAIKKYILPTYRELNLANTLIRRVNIPLALKQHNQLLNKDIASNFVDYFSKEKDCLKKIRTLLAYKSNECPYVSFSGILLVAIQKLHIANQDQLLNIINTGYSLKTGCFSVYMPEDRLKPINTEVLENINNGLERVLVKSQKLHD